MNEIAGSDLRFSLVIDGNTEIFCHATDFGLNTVTDVLETTGPSDGTWKRYIPGPMSYTITAPGVVTYSDTLNIVQLKQLQYNQTIIQWTAGDQDNGGVTFSGQMFITNISATSQFRDAFKFDMSCQGTGAELIGLNPMTKTVPLTNTKGQLLPTCPMPYPAGILWYDGTFLGVANTADDVVAIFNEYAATQGAYLNLLGFVDNCHFTMQVAWNSPFTANNVIAISGAGFVIGGSNKGDVIGEEPDNNNVIGA